MRICGHHGLLLILGLGSACTATQESISREPVSLPTAAEVGPSQGNQRWQAATSDDLLGAWATTRTEGDLASAGVRYEFLFNPEGTYYLVVLVDSPQGLQFQVLHGEWTVEQGQLDLGEGSPHFRAESSADFLRLSATRGRLVLEPLDLPFVP